VIRVCESLGFVGIFGHYYISLHLYNKMCEVGYITTRE
jgi:hypothetical protein